MATVEVGWLRATEGQRVTIPIAVQAGTNALGRYDFEVSPGTKREPRHPDAQTAFSLRKSKVDKEEHLGLRYLRLKAADHLAFEVNASGDLVEWHKGPAYTTIEGVTDNGDGTETILERDNVPMRSARRRFLKLEVRQK